MSLFKTFKLDDISRVSYIFGDDIWMKQECLDEMLEAIKQKNPNTQYYKFDGKNMDIGSIIDLCESIPLGCDQKCIVIKDLELDKLEKKTMEILCDILSNLADFCIVIIANINISVSKVKIKKFLDVIKKYGKAIELLSKNKVNALDFIVSSVKSSGSSISSQNARFLAEYCGGEIGKISQEIKKLTDFCQAREISSEDIRQLVIPSFEVKVFDLVKFINFRDKKRAHEMLLSLINNREDPIMILSVMSTSYIDIYRAKVGKTNRKTIDDVLSLFDYKGKEFRISKAFSESEKYSFSQIKDIISYLIEADHKLKSSSLDNSVILETLLCKIFRRLETV